MSSKSVRKKEAFYKIEKYIKEQNVLGKKTCHFDKAKRQDKSVHGKCMECSHIDANDNVNTNVFIRNVIFMRSHS